MLANTKRALTEEQREQWAVDGYLQLEGALSPAEVDFFSDQIDRVRMQPGFEPAPGKLPRGHYAWVDHADPNPEAFCGSKLNGCPSSNASSSRDVRTLT